MSKITHLSYHFEKLAFQHFRCRVTQSFFKHMLANQFSSNNIQFYGPNPRSLINLILNFGNQDNRESNLLTGFLGANLTKVLYSDTM